MSETATSTYIGTSGWSYPTGYGKWAGVVYPKRWRGDELAYYAERFPAVEVNATFYRVPSAEIARGWAQRTASTFRFAVKLFRKFTHPEFFQRDEGTSPEITPQDIAAMRGVLDPLAEEGKLGALLVQYPEFHRKSAETHSALVRTLDYFRDYPLAVEFRHPSWGDEQTGELLAHFNATRVRVDEPFFNNFTLPSTGTCDYWRFHGRNETEWRKPGVGHHKYDYLYSEREIDDLKEAILQKRSDSHVRFVFFNNHVSGQAVANAIALAAKLDVPLPFNKFALMSEHFPQLRGIVGETGGQLQMID